MTNRSSRNRSFADSALTGLEPLESRRMLDGAAMGSTDGAPEHLAGSPEADYESDMDESADEAGSDSDLYSFTIRPVGERPRDTMEADEPGDDHDIYDFGQDRGEAIDDETAYETGDDGDVTEPQGPIASDLSSVPVEPLSDPNESTTEAPESVAPLEEPVAIALIPAEPGITWLGGIAGPAATVQAEVEGESPASWTDLAALPELTTIVQA
jgi:hypothetical protein